MYKFYITLQTPSKMLVGDRLIDFSSLSGVLPTLAAVYNAGGDLIIICEDGSSNEGFKHTLGRMDGHVITSRMDMGQPGRVKTLHNITAMLDAAADDFFIKLYYRTEDTAAWTQAGATAENTLRAAAEDLDVEFYQLQVKVELDDDTAANTDVAIEKIGITYSIDLG